MMMMKYFSLGLLRSLAIVRCAWIHSVAKWYSTRQQKNRYHSRIRTHSFLDEQCINQQLEYTR